MFIVIIVDNPDVQARAVLCPLTSKGQPIPMSYRTLNIGTGKSDLCPLTSPANTYSIRKLNIH